MKKLIVIGLSGLLGGVVFGSEIKVAPTDDLASALASAQANDMLRLAAGTYELKSAVCVGVPLTIVGDGDVAIFTTGAFNKRRGECEIYNMLTFTNKVSVKNIRFAGATVGGARMGVGDSFLGGGIVRLQGAAAGSTFENCEWSGNLLRVSSGNCYCRYDKKTSMNRPRKELSIAAAAGALVVDLADAEGTVTLKDCTFAYNVTTYGWTAGLNVTKGRVTVDGVTFWGNIIAKRWCQYADLFVSYLGRVNLKDATFAQLGGRYFDDNDPKITLGSIRIGDPKFGTTKDEFLSKYIDIKPGIITLTATNFPFADVNDSEINDCSAPDRAKLQIGITSEPRTALQVKATAKVAPSRLEPNNAFQGWTKIMPGVVTAGRMANKLSWFAQYKMEERQVEGAQVSCGRSVYWYRHEDDPAWGRTYDNELGKGKKLSDDYFGVMKPVDGDQPGRPLVVALHGRGGGFKGFNCIALGSADSVFNVPTNSYALTLDCRGNVLNDFWWGAMPPATKEAGMTLGARQCNYNSCYYCFILGAPLFGELNIGPTMDPFKYHKMSCLEWCHKGEPPAMKRVLDTVEWAIRKFRIDRNRVYLVGNSMGGQAALAIGLRHGEVFAAVNANVPATVVYPASQMGFIDVKGQDVAAADFKLPEADPPVVMDWSGSDDAWSRDHDILYRNANRFKIQYMGWWGPYGHCGSLKKAREVNPGVCSFDIFSVKKNEAYPVFTDASSNSSLPWPQKAWLDAGGSGGKIVDGVETAKGKLVPRDGADLVGQWNGTFRWEVVEDTPKSFKIKLWCEGGADATADVSMRRLQNFDQSKGGSWTFADAKGTLKYDAQLRTATVPKLKITAEPQVLELVK